MELQSYLENVPVEITKAIGKEYRDLESRFSRKDWGPTELSGGRLAEAIYRYLEWKQSKRFTPIGTQINRGRITNLVQNDRNLPEGLRAHVLGCASLLLNVRNQRDVAHLGSDINVNEMDSRLVKRLASWSLAEIVRVESGATPEESQSVIDRLSIRSLPLVEEVGGKTIVVATNLKAQDRALVALYQRYPKSWTLDELQNAVLYKNKTRFPKILAPYVLKALIHIDGEQVFVTEKGIAWIEKNLKLELLV